MSGHSHWATIRRKKGAADAKKGAVFTRLAREVAMAAREGGGDPGMNVRLAMAIERARAQNMPKDSIERAVKKGTGEGKDGVQMEQLYYEGYAGHSVAVMLDCLTDNRNRTVAEIKHMLSRGGGSMAEAGSVGWQFKKAAYFSFPMEGFDEDKIYELAIEGGADDFSVDEGMAEIIAPVEQYKNLSDRLHAIKIFPEEAGLRMLPTNEVDVEPEKAIAVMKTIEALEELDDVVNVFHNMKMSEEVVAALEAE